MKSLRRIVLAACLSAGGASVGYGQSSPCLADSDIVIALRTRVSSIYSGTDSAKRVAAGQPWARFTNIQVVSDSSTCAAGVAAFNQKIGVAGTPAAVTSAYVLTLGGTGYAVVRTDYLDPAGSAPVFVFRSNWQPVIVVH